MKNRLHFLLILIGVSIFLCTKGENLYARPAKPGLTQIQQKDGSTLWVILKGDERLKWAESEDGYTLQRNQEGLFEYALQDETGQLVPSGVKASSMRERQASEKAFLLTCVKGLPFSVKQVQQAHLSGPQVKYGVHLPSTSLQSKKTTHYKIPLILVNFKDRKFQFAAEDFNRLVNTIGYKEQGATGSVADYFSSCSNGKLLYNADIMGPYELSREMAYYGGNGSNGNDKNPEKMVEEAVAAALKDGQDFSIYDYNQDGEVDGIHVIFAGEGEETSGEEEAIWSHEWALDPPYEAGDKKVRIYSCSPELNYPEEMSTIGVLIHEMSHALGLPDLYDTDYEISGSAVEPGAFDVMSTGSYNNDGKTPPLHNAWSRVQMGWLTKEESNDARRIRLAEPEEASKAFYIQTAVEKEYFVLDNRPKTKWDASNPGGGLFIFAINEGVPGWGIDKNCINCDAQNRGFYIKQANGGSSSTSSIGKGTPYPGSEKKTEFTDQSTPSSLNTSGQPTQKPLTEITQIGNEITCVYMGGKNAPWWENKESVENQDPFLNPDFMLYGSPNPMLNNIQIICSAPMRCIRVMNQQGRCLLERKPFATNDSFSVNFLPSGLYIIEASTPQGNKRIKVIKR